jgi:hypothetical protein
MIRILIILSVLLLVSCSKSVDIELLPEVDVFLSNDADRKIRLTEKDTEYAILNEWLKSNSSDWYVTSGHYPGGIYIKTGEYGIQVTKTHVILYSATGSQPKAIYIQGIEKGELAQILNMGK